MVLFKKFIYSSYRGVYNFFLYEHVVLLVNEIFLTNLFPVAEISKTAETLELFVPNITSIKEYNKSELKSKLS